MKATLIRNTAENSEAVPYFVTVEIVTKTVDAGTVFQIPIGVDYNGHGKTFTFEVCGFRQETSNPDKLPLMVGQLVNALVSTARLPSYVFIARRAGEIYPVYTIGREVFATTPGGPIFRHVELAKVREYLADYLNTIGILGENGVSDKLHVRGVNLHTLGLRRPIFYLKKRVPGETDFWAPVFETGDGKRIYTYAASARREVPIADGQEVIFLRELVAQALLTDGRLHDLHDLRPDRLFPDYWERLKVTLNPEGSIPVNGITIPIYSNSYVWVGLEVRADEDRYSLYVGRDAESLRRRIQIDFERRGHTVVNEPVAVPA
jgi:hypothetical protein